MRDRLHASGKWLYNWVTVLTGMVVGVLSGGMDLFETVTGQTDITPILPPDKALKIMTYVAVAKGVHAIYKHTRGGAQ